MIEGAGLGVRTIGPSRGRGEDPDGHRARATGPEEDTMVRSIRGLAALLLLGLPASAGELDVEFGPRKADTSAGTPTASRAMARNDESTVAKAGELDAESPAQAWRHWGGYGFRRGFGGFGLGRGFGYG